MEELLPLIIGILWLAYTFYSRGQKKKSAEGAGREIKPGNKPSFLEQLLAGEAIQVTPPQFEDDEEYTNFEHFVEPEPVVLRKEKEKTSPFLNMELSGYVEEGQSQFKEAFALDEKEAFALDDFEADDEYLLPSELKREIQEFDLRKAVVFSAILEAPYIDYK